MGKYVRAIKDFSGGLSEVANDNIPDNRLITAKNAIPGDGYGIARAGGTSIAFDKIATSNPVVMMAELEENDIIHVIACTENGGYWNMWDWGGNSWTQITDNGDPDILPFKDWFVYANQLFWLDGAKFRYYDGSAIADVPNSYNQTVAFWSKIQTSIAVTRRSTRWFFATKDNEVIPSEPGFYDKFTETSIINVTSTVADSITALHEFNDGILIFQKRSVYYLMGWDIAGGSDVTMSKLSVESGTKWPKSVKTISNAVLYLGDNGVYRLSVPYYNSAVATSNVSDKQASRRLTVDGIQDVFAEVFNGVYYITLRTDTGNYEYRYYLNASSWWGEFTQQPYCYGARLGGDEHMFIGCDNGYVVYYDDNSHHYVATNNGLPTVIPVEIKTKGYDVVGRTVIDSKVKRVFLVLRQYDTEKSGLEVQVKTDYTEGAWEANVSSMKGVLTAVLREVEGDESLIWDEGKWDLAYWGWIDTVTKQFQLNRKCKRIQFIFRDNSESLDSADQPLLIYGIALQYKRKKAKGSRLGVTDHPVRYDD